MLRNIVSVSGGKASTALALLAVEKQASNLQFVFADTGHEHAATYRYLEYLSEELERRTGTAIQTVRADFTKQIKKKRETVRSKWAEDGVPLDRIEQALEHLKPTGIPMLDLCLWKGRFPSTRARFCSSELKRIPIDQQVMEPALQGSQAVISWQGVRADESRARADLPEKDVEFGTWEPEPTGHLIYRPIIAWTADMVFDMHRKHGVDPNPLYKQGMSRVGCMPCIHARKSEIRSIAQRYPEEFERLWKWEQHVALVSKQGISTFFAADKTPGEEDTRSNAKAILDWAITSRGGRQVN